MEKSNDKNNEIFKKFHSQLDKEIDEFARLTLRKYEQYENQIYYLYGWLKDCQKAWDIDLSEILERIETARQLLKQGRNKMYHILTTSDYWVDDIWKE